MINEKECEIGYYDHDDKGYYKLSPVLTASTVDVNLIQASQR